MPLDVSTRLAPGAGWHHHVALCRLGFQEPLLLEPGNRLDGGKRCPGSTRPFSRISSANGAGNAAPGTVRANRSCCGGLDRDAGIVNGPGACSRPRRTSCGSPSTIRILATVRCILSCFQQWLPVPLSRRHIVSKQYRIKMLCRPMLLGRPGTRVVVIRPAAAMISHNRRSCLVHYRLAMVANLGVWELYRP